MPADNDGDGAAGGGAANAQGMAAMQGLLSFRPTLFRGTEQDSITVEAWCGTISKAGASAGWDDDVTLDCATENLRDEAATWYANTKNGFRAERHSVTSTWELFKTTITARFALDRTAIQKVNLIKDLHCGPQEKVASFFERVHSAIRKSHGDVIKKMEENPGNRTNAEKAAYTDGVEDLQKSVIKVMFLAGLRDDLRQQLQATTDFENLDLQALRTNAIRIEDSRDKSKKESSAQQAQLASIATTNQETPDLAKQLAELKKEIGAINSVNKKQKKPPGQKKEGKAKKSQTNIGATPIAQRTHWIRCHACKQWGLHMARECPRSAGELESLEPGNVDKPNGPAFDRLFPSPN